MINEQKKKKCNDEHLMLLLKVIFCTKNVNLVVLIRPVQNCIFWGTKMIKQYLEACGQTKQIQTKLNILKSKLTISNKYK